MNLLREIASWRPEVEPLDPDTADQIWEQILNGGEASTASPASLAPPRENQISLRSRDAGKPHSRSLVATVAAAAAVLLVVVGGLVVVGNRVCAPVTNEAPTTSDDSSTDGDLGGATGTLMSWEPFPAMPIAPRYLEAAVSTDDGIFVWGGLADESSTTLSDGAYYDGERWRVLPEAPLDPAPGGPTAVWTGTEVVVVSGSAGLTTAAFDPGSFTWRPIAPPQGQLDGFVFPPLFHLGDGRLAFMWRHTVQTYDPTTDTWSEPSGLRGWWRRRRPTVACRSSGTRTLTRLWGFSSPVAVGVVRSRCGRSTPVR